MRPFVIVLFACVCFYGFWGCFSEFFSRRLFRVNFISNFVVTLLFAESRSDSVLSDDVMVEHGAGRHRRSRGEVIVEILTEALEGVNKTRLMYRCNLNFERFNRYLRELLDAGLLERVVSNPESGVVLYKTTEKGRELLEILRRVNEFMSV